MLKSLNLSRILMNQSAGLRGYKKDVGLASTLHQNKRFIDSSLAADVCKDVNKINLRLGNLSLTSQYLTGSSLLNSPTTSLQPSAQIKKIHLPTESKRIIEAPSSEIIKQKTFITTIKSEVKEPEIKTRISEPITIRIKKHAARMLLVRRRKMKKHKLKRLWDRMYLKFLANKSQSKKRSEIQFRGRLAAKVNEARKFDAEAYVKKYLTELHTPLIPATYKGKRLPQWLIVELMENDKLLEKEALMEGKTYTTKEDILRQGDTVKSFVERTWK